MGPYRWAIQLFGVPMLAVHVLALLAAFDSFLPPPLLWMWTSCGKRLVEGHPRRRQAALKIMTATRLASTGGKTNRDKIDVVVMKCMKQTYLASAGRRSSSLLS